MRSRKPRKGRRWGAGLFDPRGTELPQDWVDVADAPDGISAGLLESVLAGAGIPVMVWRPPFFPFMGSGGMHSILVPEAFREQALAMLSERWDVCDDLSGDGVDGEGETDG